MGFLGKETLVGLFIVFLCVSFSAGASGQEVKTITVQREGWFEGTDGLMGKDRAIKDALVKAVEQAVGTMISSGTRARNFQLLNDEIYTKTEGYVQDYQIIGENQRKNVYEVTILATVATGLIKEKLDGLGLLLQQVSKPRIMILVAEQNIGKPYYSNWWGRHRGEQANLPIAESAIMDRFRERGFEFVDHTAESKDVKAAPGYQVAGLNDPAAITLGKQVDAEVVIVGKALVKSAGNIAGTSMKSVQANISLRAIQTDNGRVLSSGTERAAAVHIDEVTAGAEALKKASAKISQEMIDDIIKNFQKRDQEIEP